MAAKDTAFHQFAMIKENFADVFNGSACHGEPVISPDDLEYNDVTGFYHGIQGLPAERRRDVAMQLKGSGVTLALVNMEHQSAIDPLMPIRSDCYDATFYNRQLADKDARPVRPVITLVIYLGSDPWIRSVHLTDAVDMKSIPKALWPLVQDYRMNLYDIPALSQEGVDCYHGDFRVIADYCRRMRQEPDKRYEGDDTTITYPRETLDLMTAITGDPGFSQALLSPAIQQLVRQGETTMKSVLKDIREEGLTQGREQGLAQGREQGLAQGREQGLAQGRAEGEATTKRRLALNMIHDKAYTDEQIARVTELTLDEIHTLHTQA